MPFPKLGDDQIVWVIQQVAQYIERQRQTYRHRAVSLDQNQNAAIQAFFPASTLNSTRLVVLTGERVGNPPFYGQFMRMGFEAGSLPDFAQMAAITFVDTVVSHESFTNKLDESSLAQIRVEAANTPEAIEAQRRIAAVELERQQATQAHLLDVIFRTPVNGKVAVDAQANRQMILSWLDETKGEHVASPGWFVQVLKDTPGLAKSIAWQSADAVNPVKQREAAFAQAEEDRVTFNAFAREFGFSEVEANFRLAVSVLGSGLTTYQLRDAISSNALNLAPAPQEELATFQREAYEERVDFLMHRATPLELKAAARKESEQSQVQQRAAQQVKIRQDKESAIQYPQLPAATPDGRIIDRAFLLNLANTDITKYKQWCTYHGFAQITARLNGVS